MVIRKKRLPGEWEQHVQRPRVWSKGNGTMDLKRPVLPVCNV